MTTPNDGLDERRQVAEQIVAASGSMQDASRHLLWLLTQPVRRLNARLLQVRQEAPYSSDRAGWRERAARKAQGGAV